MRQWRILVCLALIMSCNILLFPYFFTDWSVPYIPGVEQEEMVPYSYEEVMGTIENGDILITFDSHFGNWRNGHAGIVVDAKNGTILEAKTLGINSSFANINRWRIYNSFAVLRLTELSLEKRSEIALYAQQKLYDVPYTLFPKVTKFPLEDDISISGTHCSHLIWLSYMQHGYDLDSDGGIIVTPRDLYDSPDLQQVAVYITSE